MAAAKIQGIIVCEVNEIIYIISVFFSLHILPDGYIVKIN